MSNLVKDLADTLRAVVAARATGMPIDPILPEVKAVLERAEVASVVLGGMRSEQRADFEALVEFAPKDNATFSMLFALVRELDSAASLNCMLLNAATDSFHDERHRADRAEQQLATVTAERDELRREVGRLTEQSSARFQELWVTLERGKKAESELAAIRADMAVAEDYPTHYWRELCQKAETERDALRAELKEAEWLIEHAPAATLGEPDEMAWLNRESAWSRARELARLNGEKGSG